MRRNASTSSRLLRSVASRAFRLRRSRSRTWRVLGWVYVAAFLVLISQNSKAYYLAPAYPPLFAAGAVAIESWTRNRVARLALPARIEQALVFIEADRPRREIELAGELADRVGGCRGGGRVSDSRGDFRFPGLQAGTYTVKVEMQGFKTFEKRNNVLNAASTLSRASVGESTKASRTSTPTS